MKCRSCHRKKTMKKVADINRFDTYECAVCGTKYIPLYHKNKAKRKALVGNKKGL